MNVREQLPTPRTDCEGLREESADWRRSLDSAKAVVAENETDATLGAALGAKQSVAEVDHQIDAVARRSGSPTCAS